MSNDFQPVVGGYDFESRRQHAWNKIEWHTPKDKRGRFLDIGCGPGNGVVAAIQHGFSMAIGIDRDMHEFPDFRSGFNELCRHYGVPADKGILIEADIFQTNFTPSSFDCVLFLDSIEHVPNPEAFINYGAKAVAPGGVLVVDTCPLYYSKVGHHLFGSLPAEQYPWAHFRRDFVDLCAERGVDAWSMQRYKELSGVTHQQVRDMMQAAGLEIIQEHRSLPTDTDLELLEANRKHLKLDGIDESLLFEDWVLLVGRKTEN